MFSQFEEAVSRRRATKQAHQEALRRVKQSAVAAEERARKLRHVEKIFRQLKVSQKEVACEAGAAATGAESVAIAGVEEERRRLREVQEEMADLEIASHTRAAELEELEKEASVARLQMEENIAAYNAAMDAYDCAIFAMEEEEEDESTSLASASASLAIITPDPDSASSSGSGRVEKPVTLSQLVGKVKNGTSALAGFKEDRRNVAKAVHPLYYGAFSSHGPTHDSTFANLTKAETELVYSTYGDDVGVSYAESIKNFSRNCEYATVIVDHLLDILTDQQHRKTSKYLEEQQLLREEESVVDDAFTDSRIDFDSLKSLEKEGIDMSFLGDLERRYHGEPAAALGATAGLLEELRGAQHERLAGAASSNLAALPEVGPREAELAERVQGGLAEMVSAVRPRDLLPSSMAGVRRAMGLPETL